MNALSNDPEYEIEKQETRGDQMLSQSQVLSKFSTRYSSIVANKKQKQGANEVREKSGTGTALVTVDVGRSNTRGKRRNRFS